MKKPATFFTIFLYVSMYAQDSTERKNFIWDIFLESYYSFDYNKPANHQKTGILYNHNRHNEANINLALGKISYKNEKIALTMGLMAGTYPEVNLASEPAVLKNVYEANAGVKLLPKKDLWFTAGIFPSHIGFESAINNENWTLTRSLLAENSPYYEAGFKLGYTSKDQKWYLSGLVLNGWQRIRRPEANNSIAIGTQVTFKPSGKFMVNSSTFMGNDKPDSAKQWRYFHNLYLMLNVSAKFSLLAGFDYGLEQREMNSSKFNRWYSPVLIIRYSNKEWSLTARAEYYDDNNGVIISLINAQPFEMQGYSLNVDKNVGKSALIRLEARYLKNSTSYFQRGLNLVNDAFILTGSLVFFLSSN